MHMSGLFDTVELAQMIDEGYVRTQHHLGLTVLNYTQKAQYGRVWNDVTKQCRGLIVDQHNNVIARPFAKFFNYGEHDDVHLPHFQRAVVTEKLDGSLGVIYPVNGGYAVATRGSFTSPQAQHATAVLNARYGLTLGQRLQPGHTYLVEIIYPENRIVVDYGTYDDLVLLDIVDNETGLSSYDKLRNTWTGPVVDHHTFKAWRDALAVQRHNREGFVVHFPETGLRVKVKHDEYVRLHRILTNVSTTSIWDILRNGESLETVLDGVPDEFYDWVHLTVDVLMSVHGLRQLAAVNAFKTACGKTGLGWVLDAAGLPKIWGPLPPYARKKFAEVAAAQSPELRPLLFNLLDGKSITDAIWRQIKPAHSKPFAVALEDAA